MAQLVEHILGKDEVISSNLISSSNPTDQVGFLVCIGIFIRGQTALKKRKILSTFLQKGVDKRRNICYTIKVLKRARKNKMLLWLSW